MAFKMLGMLRAGLEQREMPPLTPSADVASVSNAAEYAGSYGSGGEEMEITASGDRLTLRWHDEDIALERRGEDSFYVTHPELERFLMEFGREDGKVVEAFHGPEWRVGQGYSGPRVFEYPEEWDSYTGHYRTYNFGLTNFRVVQRKGSLLLIYPNGGRVVLTPLGDDTFRIGEDPRSPETLRFDSVASGKALRAVYSGCPYYRTYMP